MADTMSSHTAQKTESMSAIMSQFVTQMHKRKYVPVYVIADKITAVVYILALSHLISLLLLRVLKHL